MLYKGRKKRLWVCTHVAVTGGKKQFLTQRAMCQGGNGNGQGDLSEELNVPLRDFTRPDVLSKRTESELFAIIGLGSETMPGQDKQLLDKRRWQIVNYLRT